MPRRRLLLPALALGALVIVGGGGAAAYFFIVQGGAGGVDRVSHLHGLAVHAGNGRDVLLATHEGLVVGEPGGAWRVRDAWKGHADAFATYPSSWGRLWATAHEDGKSSLYASTDGGDSWKRLASAQDAHALAPSPAASGLVWSARGGALHASADDGRTWRAIAVPEAIGAVAALRADPAAPEGLYAATPTGLHYSPNAAATWQTLREGSALAVEVDVNDPSRVYASFMDGVYASPDGGESWRRLDVDAGTAPIMHIAVNPQDPRMVYAATSRGLVFRSADTGATWDVVFGR